MSLVAEVAVETLAGRSDRFECQLNSDVNIFFGENGTGKTGLLKILHGALALQNGSLAVVAFTRARVWVEPNHSLPDVRTFHRPEELDLLLSDIAPRGRGYSQSILDDLVRSDNFGWSIEQFNPQKRPASKAAASGTKPVISRPSDRVKSRDAALHRARHAVMHGYLPITRLTTDVIRSNRYYSQSGASGGDDVDMDEFFSESLQDRWKTYTNRVLSNVRRAQEDALAQVLEVVLSPVAPDESAVDDINTEQAYQRVISFLGRQRSSKRLGIDLKKLEFGREYRADPKLRRVVNLIDQVEGRIEEIMKTRVALQDLVTELMGQNKTVYFTDEAIYVELNSRQQRIGLARLSCGEKQLLRILVETMMAGNNPIIIDEPELSMHIDWQRRLLSAMRTVNPDAQIIVATHSPEIMADYDDDKVFSL
ncbi:AAA family ATPase [Micromonospora olivasterospora]|nr:AAA family ATPase [Micromonospora olivasterospora]